MSSGESTASGSGERRHVRAAGLEPDRSAARRAKLGRRREAAAIVVIVLVAALLRVPTLGGLTGAGLPPGLHVDEAYNILDAREVLAGWRPVFLPANAGRDVAYTYWQAALFGAFGETRAVARAASAVLGVLTVLCAWGFVRTLPIARRRLLALLVAGLTAVSFWHIHFSRFGIRAVAFPLAATLVMWLWWSAVGRLPERGATISVVLARSWPKLMLLAVALGVAAYVHPAGRALVVVPAVHAAYRWLRARDSGPAVQLAIAAVGALIVALPLVVFWWRHPWLFSGHAEEVSIVGSGMAALAGNMVKVSGMFNLAGDPAPWRNLPGRPVFDPVTGVLFVIGLVMVVRALVSGSDWAALTLIWFLVLLLPTVLTDAAPNFSRAIGIIPVVFLLPALALEALSDWLARRIGAVAAGLFLMGWIAVSGAWAAYDYYEWSREDDTHMAFDDEKVALAQLVNRIEGAGSEAYLSEFMAGHPTVRVVAQSSAGFYPAYGLVVSPKRRSTYAFVDYEHDAISDISRRLAVHGAPTKRVETDTGGHGRLHDLVYFEVEADELRARLANIGERGAAFGDSIRLAGMALPETATAGKVMTATLVWESLQPTGTDLNTAVHVVSAGDVTVAQGDGPPIGGSYPTDHWRTGELVISDHAIDLPYDAAAGRALIRVGWYDWRTAEALSAPDGSTLVTVGSVEILR